MVCLMYMHSNSCILGETAVVMKFIKSCEKYKCFFLFINSWLYSLKLSTVLIFFIIVDFSDLVVLQRNTIHIQIHINNHKAGGMSPDRQSWKRPGEHQLVLLESSVARPAGWAASSELMSSWRPCRCGTRWLEMRCLCCASQRPPCNWGPLGYGLHWPG